MADFLCSDPELSEIQERFRQLASATEGELIDEFERGVSHREWVNALLTEPLDACVATRMVRYRT
jgi:hypothetical protein